MAKLIYYIINIYSKKQALNYAIYRQIKSTKKKDSMEWYYWYEKIMNNGKM